MKGIRTWVSCNIEILNNLEKEHKYRMTADGDCDTHSTLTNVLR